MKHYSIIVGVAVGLASLGITSVLAALNTNGFPSAVLSLPKANTNVALDATLQPGPGCTNQPVLTLRSGRSTSFSMPVLKPNPNTNYCLRVVKPPEGTNYTMRFIR
jgi:hypothetical protein